MRIPQVIMAVGLVALIVLLLSPQGHPPRYNAASEVTVSGVVQEVRVFFCPVSGDEGTHLALATEHGVVEVHVAPSRYLLDKQWQFFRGDRVEVTGSQILYRGHQALIARTVARGSEVVAVRRPNGIPLWVE